MASYSWWRPPRLRPTHDDEERRATWFELFCDLVFAAAIAQLSSATRAYFTPEGLARYVALFVLIWWVWVIYTFYADRFDTDDVLHRVLILAGMLAMCVVAVSIGSALGGGAPTFVAGYLAARGMIVALYTRAARHVVVARRIAWNLALGSSLSAVLWLTGLAFAHVRTAAWLCALAIELAVPFVARSTVGSTPRSVNHLSERYGLFTIIVLGESVFGVITGLQGHLSAGAAVTATAGFIVAASFWWLYFNVSEAAPIASGFGMLQCYSFGHLAIALGIASAGPGVTLAITGAANGSPYDGQVTVLFAGGCALFLTGCATVRVVMVGRVEPVVVGPAVTAVLALGLLLAGVLSSVTVTVVGLALLMAGLVAYEVWTLSRPRPYASPEIEGVAEDAVDV
jgi:low temperature requirement protein LtrA